MSNKILNAAHKATDKKLARMESHIRAVYSKAAKEAEKKAERVMAIFEKQDKAEKAKLTAGQITQKQYDEWRERAFIQGSHYKNLTEQFADDVLNVHKTAISYANGELPSIYAQNINAVNQTIKRTVRGYSFELMDSHTVKNLLVDKPNLLPLKKVNDKKVVRWAKSKINTAFTQGFLQGESIPKIAKRIADVTGIKDRHYAVTDARTMVTSAENKGREDGMRDAEEQGIVLEKEWIATNDNRTRDWHAELDGERVKPDESFKNEYGEIMFPGDPSAEPANVYNCRCTLGTHIIGFRGKNGFVGVE